MLLNNLLEFPGSELHHLKRQSIHSNDLCEGEGDDLPESAFMYVGTLDDAKAKAESMAAAAVS